MSVARKIFLIGIIKHMRNEVRFLKGAEKNECEKELEILQEELNYYQ